MLAEFFDDAVHDVAGVDFAARLEGHRRDAGVRDAAGDDLAVGGKVVAAVDGNAVHGHAVLDADADGPDLAVRTLLVGGNPDACPALYALGPDAVILHDGDHDGFEPLHVVPNAGLVLQLQDRVGNELAGAVPSQLA